MVHTTYYHRVNEARAEIIRQALDAAGGNKSAAARALGMKRPNLIRTIKALGVRASAAPAGSAA